MKHTTRIKLVNRADRLLAASGAIEPEKIRQVTLEDAVVDTGTTRLALPKPLIEQLGLTPVGSIPVRTTTGIVDRNIYSEVRFTVMEREETLNITDYQRVYRCLLDPSFWNCLTSVLTSKKG